MVNVFHNMSTYCVCTVYSSDRTKHPMDTVLPTYNVRALDVLICQCLAQVRLAKQLIMPLSQYDKLHAVSEVSTPSGTSANRLNRTT
ncbi:b8.1 [Ichnoviriform fugitivi]|uniref:B8.1 n=1 Tax=Ichnoviriform fugitivi TaxID=265522 RepID=Q6PL41_9VIRU|nr:b8.1 [Ichnoviriform fugitivi]AAT09008.1 b8.1 [Ichnoviriform fugitivi]